eukprot:15464111-Alexandrium_andersonii.AAC.1
MLLKKRSVGAARASAFDERAMDVTEHVSRIVLGLAKHSPKGNKGPNPKPRVWCWCGLPATTMYEAVAH